MRVATLIWPRANGHDGIIERAGRAAHWLGYGAAALWATAAASTGHGELLVGAMAFAAGGRALRYVLSGE